MFNIHVFFGIIISGSRRIDGLSLICTMETTCALQSLQRRVDWTRITHEKLLSACEEAIHRPISLHFWRIFPMVWTYQTCRFWTRSTTFPVLKTWTTIEMQCHSCKCKEWVGLLLTHGRSSFQSPTKNTRCTAKLEIKTYENLQTWRMRFNPLQNKGVLSSSFERLLASFKFFNLSGCNRQQQK